GDLPPHTVNFLIDQGFALAYLPTGKPQHQVASRVHFELLRALDAQRDGSGIGSRSDDEVVLQLPWASVGNEVDPGGDVRVPDLGIDGNIGTPLLGVVADEVVHLAGQFFHPRHLRVRLGAQQLHAKYG